MILKPGVTLLKGRYELFGTPHEGSGGSQIWRADGPAGEDYLVKIWGYEGEQPDPVQRALWDQELRTLYKIASSPRAEETLVVLKDAGLDRVHQSFVMVLEAPGHVRMTDALRRRLDFPWLSLRNDTARARLWKGLEGIARGLQLLHDRRVLHRDVDTDAIMLSEHQGPESMRLGGFEWSVKLGRPVGGPPPPDRWSSPPNSARSSGWRQDDDWFSFAMVCSRVLLPEVENFLTNAPELRYARIISAIERSTRDLTEAERTLLSAMLRPDPLDRLVAPHDIIGRMHDIVQLLSTPRPSAQAPARYVMVLNLNNVRLIDHLMVQGLRDHIGLGPTESFRPNDPQHRVDACQFVRRHMDNAILYAIPNREGKYIDGGKLIFHIEPFRPRGEQTPTWQVAHCSGPAVMTFNRAGDAMKELPRGSVYVHSMYDVNRDRTIIQNATSWESVLPVVDRGAQATQELARLHNFLRATNQIELLLLDAQIFPYEVIRGPIIDDGREHLWVRGVARPDEHKIFQPFDVSFTDYLLKETESSVDRTSVILSHEQYLMLPPRSDVADDDHMWRISRIVRTTDEAELVRPAHADRAAPPPVRGYLRSAGMPGQISLFRRRKQAIDALDQHGYLMRSLAAPAQVSMDTEEAEFPVPLPEEKVDAPKRASIEDILRVRPIYTLQGPPGTGKTTLVSWLLREIFAEDPVSQVLVTAQAHGAVDVLRQKVREVFADLSGDQRPLELRLGAKYDSDDNGRGGAGTTAREVLEASIGELERLGDKLTDIQRSWLDDAKAMIIELHVAERDTALGRRATDFVELVKRGANFTYCTTSARDLVALAAEQTFDWSIVEEAGKAHGFDLALPLQAGHRWLLIGDHKQLNPYRYEDYRQGVDQIERVVELLGDLRPRAGGLIDYAWLNAFGNEEETAAFREHGQAFLTTFAQLFSQCAVAQGASNELITTTDPVGAAAGRLIGQHRMHPDIGELISVAFYSGDLRNETATVNRGPLERVRHSFVTPAGIGGRAVVWLDVPWCKDDLRTLERGKETSEPPYTNPAEAFALRRFLEQLGPEVGGSGTLAVLSPYARQVGHLGQVLKGITLAPGLQPRQGLHDDRSRSRALTYTVDSFQGNQADVVAVSLVRNNQLPTGEGLGFLTDNGRMNVLLSRAERLLVLVGSWDFFNSQVRTVPLDDTTQPLWSLRKIMSVLGEWEQSGRMVKIDADLRGF